jgi:integrase
MFGWCIEQKWIGQNPFASVRAIGTPRRGKPKLRVNASRQFMAYLLADPSPEATAVLMAFMLALRASAVVNRRVEDLDDDGWLLWVRDNKTEAGDLEIEIPGVLRERLLHLAEGKQPTDRLFGDVDRHWLAYHTVRLCEAAGVPRVTPHGLRGSGATQAVRLGGSLEQVAEAIGHADRGATLKAHYLGGGAIESARGRKIAELLPPPGVDLPIEDTCN